MRLSLIFFILSSFLLPISGSYGEQGDPYQELFERFERDLGNREMAVDACMKDLEKLNLIAYDVRRSTSKDVQLAERDIQVYQETVQSQANEFHHPREYNFTRRLKAVHEGAVRLQERVERLGAAFKELENRSSIISKQMIERIPDLGPAVSESDTHVRIDDYSKRLSLIEKSLEYAEKKVGVLEEERTTLEENISEHYKKLLKNSVFDSKK